MNPTIMHMKQTRGVWSTLCSRISVVFKAMLGKFLFPFHHPISSYLPPISDLFILSLIHFHPLFPRHTQPHPTFPTLFSLLRLCLHAHVTFPACWFLCSFFCPPRIRIRDDPFSFHILFFDDIFLICWAFPFIPSSLFASPRIQFWFCFLSCLPIFDTTLGSLPLHFSTNVKAAGGTYRFNILSSSV